MSELLVRYGGAVAAPLAATAAGWLPHGAFGATAALSPFYAAVSLVALAWGGAPGALATGLRLTARQPPVAPPKVAVGHAAEVPARDHPAPHHVPPARRRRTRLAPPG